MAASKRLSAEIDRTLKKVKDGISTFDDIWEKVYSADTHALQEKHEGDLKKEIKRLQRMREQMRGWMDQASIRDQERLQSARENIETKMDQFRDCEREVKTKKYSIEGLERSMTLDPAERAKQDAMQYVQSKVATLLSQVEEIEAEVEAEEKKRRRADQSHIASLEKTISDHRFHVDRLEAVARLLDNEVLPPAELDKIKDDLEYYIESCREPDYLPDLGVYEDLDLDELLAHGVQVVAVAAAAGGGAAEAEEKREDPAAKEPKPKKKGKKKGKKDKGISLAGVTAAAPKRKVKDSNSEASHASGAGSPLLTAQAATPRSQAKTAGILGGLDPASVSPQCREERQQRDAQKVKAGAQLLRAKPTVADANGAVAGMQLAHPELVSDAAAVARIHRALQQSLEHIPVLADVDRPVTRLPQLPTPTHLEFPKVPLKALETPEAFAKLDIESLFFAFFHQQGTYNQYLAAQQLRQQSWRFNTAYQTWFQRNADPIEVTEEHERGSYMYFDTKSRRLKVKEDFVFKYAHLENEL